MTMTATNHDSQLGENYPKTLNKFNCTSGVTFSRFHCCGHYGHGMWPSWLCPSWYRPILPDRVHPVDQTKPLRLGSKSVIHHWKCRGVVRGATRGHGPQCTILKKICENKYRNAQEKQRNFHAIFTNFWLIFVIFFAQFSGGSSYSSTALPAATALIQSRLIIQTLYYMALSVFHIQPS